MSKKKRRNETSERKAFRSINTKTTSDEMEQKWAEFKAKRMQEVNRILSGTDPLLEERQNKLADYKDDSEFESEVLSPVLTITSGHKKYDIAFLRSDKFDACVHITYEAHRFEDEALEELFKTQYLLNNKFPDGTPFRWIFRGQKVYDETLRKHSLKLTYIATEIQKGEYVARLRQLAHKIEDMKAFVEMQNENAENAELKQQMDLLHMQMGTEKFVEMLKSIGATTMIPTTIGGIPYVREVRKNRKQLLK